MPIGAKILGGLGKIFGGLCSPGPNIEPPLLVCLLKLTILVPLIISTMECCYQYRIKLLETLKYPEKQSYLLVPFRFFSLDLILPLNALITIFTVYCPGFLVDHKVSALLAYING